MNGRKRSDQYLVLLEQIRGEVKLVAEGHDQLNHKIDRLESSLSEKIESVKLEVRLIGQQFQTHIHNPNIHI